LRQSVNLTNGSETMLWALHHRASEARRSDGVLIDPESIQIHESIEFDFNRHFGQPHGSLAARAAAIDHMLRQWIEQHPDGTVVSLGEGLETQARRVDNGRMRWLSVDLPDAIHLREQFLTPTERFRHVATNVLDHAVWMDQIDPRSDVMIIAQGLLMYLQPAQVRDLFTTAGHRFPAAEMVFDVVPRWFSHLTVRGLQQTAYYRLPAMPWGINRNEIVPTLQRWQPRCSTVRFLDYHMPRAPIMAHLPVVRNEVPSLVHVTFDDATKQIDDDFGAAVGRVITKRMMLGITAAPEDALHEFSRIIPEKIEAFTDASTIMLEQVAQAQQQTMYATSIELAAQADAMWACAGCVNPAAWVEMQSKLALMWVQRAAENYRATWTWAIDAQNAVMLPIRQTVSANVARLGGTS
jgi:O-methyltransferase involved in polyketide biosynthesis